jgi:hypothetical protein
MADPDHVLFIVKANDGSTVRLSLVERLLEDTESFEVVIYGLSPEQVGKHCFTVGGLIFWSPDSPECYEATPESDEARQHRELIRQRVATRPDVVDNERVIFALWTPSGYIVRALSELLALSAQSACLPGNQKLSLQMMQAWAAKVFHERQLSPEELAELDRRTNAACEKYGWPDLGKQYDALGEHEQTRNIAYLMLHREMTFRGAAFEYLAALEKGSRQLAADAELDSSAANLLSVIAANLETAAIGLGAGQAD